MHFDPKSVAGQNKIRLILHLILILLICLTSTKKLDANPALILAPGVAIGSLEVMAATAAGAAAIGMISASRNREFQAAVAAAIEKIKTATMDAVRATLDDTIFLYRKIMGSSRPACPTPSQPSKTSDCSESIDACCGDFFAKFGDKATRARGGIIIKRNRKKFECCMEWDHLHGGLEVFDERGNHMGERGCDDLTDDPCEWTRSRGKHAEPASSTHKPRSAACQP